MSYFAHLPDRAVIAVSGADRVKFLQGLVSNDVAEARDGRAVWAALLTPQGRWKADFFMVADPDGEQLLLDCPASQVEMVITTLKRFRLRSDVSLVPASFAVHAAWGALPDAATVENAIVFADPRLPEAGWRLLLPDVAQRADADAAAYDLHRLTLGLPDGPRDCEADKTLLLEANFDLLNGVSWTKGCYMGQELTARTRYRGLVKRRLVPFASVAPSLTPGAPVMAGGVEVGQVRSSRDHCGLAMVRPAAVLAAGETPMTVEGHTITPRAPEWLREALRAGQEPEASKGNEVGS
ncbi:folate-binding protein YgfZ [Acetobacter sp. DsW_063]|uniref:CAF17-like 4Fe-4S cluster assembly/insertion protein YgfZ n=1 Tax=Acetobacter sp. DsW_063 TaxID=1514894 RepID=UPI000A3962AD|nr:folate-binding protein YgfZ [Acetobacter sp. DsW_063]